MVTIPEAIRFAVEEFPAVRTLGAWMQIGEVRYNMKSVACMKVANIRFDASAPATVEVRALNPW